MLKIHTSDGQTHRLDLTSDEDARFWLPKLSRHDFQETIKGISVVERHNVGKCRQCGMSPDRDIGVQYSITRPELFRKIFFNVENIEQNGKIKGGEKVIVFIDDIRLILMAHYSQPAARVTITKVGNQKFNPYRRGRNG